MLPFMWQALLPPATCHLKLHPAVQSGIIKDGLEQSRVDGGSHAFTRQEKDIFSITPGMAAPGTARLFVYLQIYTISKVPGAPDTGQGQPRKGLPRDDTNLYDTDIWP